MLIQNIYYMLAYAFTRLTSKEYASVSAEEFEDARELLEEILILEVSSLVKRGLTRQYRELTEPLNSPKGKIELPETMRSRSRNRNQVSCTHDEFAEDWRFNQILKTTMDWLLHSDISTDRKKRLRLLLPYFQNVKKIPVNRISWNIRYTPDNIQYRLSLSICELIFKGLLQNEEDGSYRLNRYLDEQTMDRLYQRFIFNYYKKEHPEIQVTASQIDWQLDGPGDSFLPVMQTDIMLQKENRVLIIDAKYYKHIFAVYYGKEKHHTGNLYQIFAYVKNKQEEMKRLIDQGNSSDDSSNCGFSSDSDTVNNSKPVVAGVLLYAATEESTQADSEYLMSGNEISVKTLDLNQDFMKIRNQLDRIAEGFFRQ